MMYPNMGGLNPSDLRGLQDEDLLQRYDKLRTAQSLQNLQNQALMQNQLQSQAALINAGGIYSFKFVLNIKK